MSDRTSWPEFERRCLKLGTNEFGSWTARRLARPIALRITWCLLPLGATANSMTVFAMLLAAAAIASFAWGGVVGLLVGGLLLEAWYVADHVDGQLARYRGAASLDGTALDYLMHHLVNAFLPLGTAYGVARSAGSDVWLLVGIVWSAALLSCGLRHDVRYKAFVQRLKLVYGRLEVVGGGGGRPIAESRPRGLRANVTWCAAKLCEVHAMAHLFVLASLGCFLFPQLAQAVPQAMMALLATSATIVAATRIVRELRRNEAETQFKLWYRLPTEAQLAVRNGRWFVETAEAAGDDESAETPAALRSS